MCGKQTVDSIFGYFIARIQFIDLAIGARCLSVHLIDKKRANLRENEYEKDKLKIIHVFDSLHR